jgi:hypothetical protein
MSFYRWILTLCLAIAVGVPSAVCFSQSVKK